MVAHSGGVRAPLGLALLAAFGGGCTSEPCADGEPGVLLEVGFGGAAPLSIVVEVEFTDQRRRRIFDVPPGDRTSLFVVLEPPPAAPFMITVGVRAFNGAMGTGQPLAEYSGAHPAQPDACNRIEVSLTPSKADAGVDAGAIDAATVDASPLDASPVDASPLDAARADAAPPDAARLDAAEVDTGATDGAPTDAEPDDTGVADAGILDGPGADATTPDAQFLDAEVADADPPDAAAVADAGTVDATAPDAFVIVGCGDGMIDGAEMCDDGNTTPGDGCNASCGVEPGSRCLREPSVCVTTADTTFIDPSCSGSGTGAPTSPMCSFAEALATGRTAIVARPGTYNESVTLAAALVIVAEDNAVLDAGGGLAIRARTGADLTVVGLTIRGSVSIENNNTQARLREVRIGPSTGVGVRLGRGATMTLERAIVDSHAAGGVWLDSDDGYRIVNTIVANSGTSSADFGGVHIKRTSGSSVFSNNTVADNISIATAPAGGVLCDVAATVVNTIVWNNERDGAASTVNATCVVTYSDLGPGGTPGTTNFDADPQFNNFYELSSSSPCRGVADPRGVEPTGPAPTIDLQGDRRPLGSGVDLGADEVP